MQQAWDFAGAARPTRPFFSYFGGKWRAAPLYERPLHDTIVEPFAGAAGYSAYWRNHRVVLCDVNPKVVAIWRYLIGATSRDILALPVLSKGDRLSDIQSLIDVERWFLGHWINQGGKSPRNVCTEFGSQRWTTSARAQLAEAVNGIKHWTVYQCSYADCPVSHQATWFIDPPYQVAGRDYPFGSSLIDYAQLAAWCMSRQGQVTVCENAGADWLSFQPFATLQSVGKLENRFSHEVVWYQRNAASVG